MFSLPSWCSRGFSIVIFLLFIETPVTIFLFFFFRGNLLAVNSLSFPFSENYFIFLFVPGRYFHSVWGSGLTVLFYQHLKTFCSFFWPLWFLERGLLLFTLFYPIVKMSFFFCCFWDFKKNDSNGQKFNYMYLGVDFFGFNLLGFSQLLESVGLCVLPNFEPWFFIFSHYFF